MAVLKAGFIGAGPRAQSAHYPMVAEIDRVDLVAMSELDEERGRQVATKYSYAPMPLIAKCSNGRNWTWFTAS